MPLRFLLARYSAVSLLTMIAALGLPAGMSAQQPIDSQAELPVSTGSNTPNSACPCQAAESELMSPTFGGPLLERSKLTGDWLGARTRLLEQGITLDISTTQFYQGVASGGLEQEFPYGGRNDYFLNVDGQKAGLWQGLFITLHGETRYGESPNFITGALSPVNQYLLVPDDNGLVTALTGVKFSQFLSEDAVVYLGKINILDAVKQPLTGASGLEGFLNTSLIFNTIFARTLPYSTFGAGFSLLQDKHALFTFAVYDTNNTPTVSGFETFFDNGATMFAALNLPTCLFGLPGHQGVSGTYSSGRYTNLEASAYLDPIEGLAVRSPLQSGSWSLAYNFDQAFHVSPVDPKRMWGVFGGLGIADDNPNPVHWYASAGLSGASPLSSRKLDTFGIGFFYLGVSDPLKRSAQPGSPLGDEHGVELFYNLGFTPWFRMTPDLQIIDPFQQQADTALVFGLRATIDF